MVLSQELNFSKTEILVLYTACRVNSENATPVLFKKTELDYLAVVYSRMAIPGKRANVLLVFQPALNVQLPIG